MFLDEERSENDWNVGAKINRITLRLRWEQVEVKTS